jgi:hypothetical protein
LPCLRLAAHHKPPRSTALPLRVERVRKKRTKRIKSAADRIPPPRRDDLSAYDPDIGERPIYRPAEVRWCGVFQVVKTAQSRGRTERTLLYRITSALRRRALAGRRDAADRRNTSLRCHVTVCYIQVITPASADVFPMVGGRCTGRAHRCKAKQGRRGKTALKFGY